jgi:hypothetical protein
MTAKPPGSAPEATAPPPATEVSEGAQDAAGRSRSRGRPHRRAWIGLSAVLIATVLVLLIALPNLAPTTGSSEALLDFGAALSSSDAVVDHVGSGNWTLILALGFDSPSATNWSGLQGFIPFGDFPICGWAPIANASLPSFPASGAALGSGTAPTWVLVYRNATAGIVASVGSGGAEVLSMTPNCGELLAHWHAIPAGAVSSEFAAAAVSTYATPYADEFPAPTQLYEITGNPMLGSYPSWQVDFWSCGTGHAEVVSSLNASSGHVWGATVGVGTACSPQPISSFLSRSLGISLPWIVSNTSSGEVLVGNVTMATNGTTWSDTVPVLESLSYSFFQPTSNLTRTVLPVTSGWSLVARGPTNETVAEFDPSTWSWSGDAGGPILVNDSIVVDLSPSVASNYDNNLDIGGAGPFWGFLELGA